MNYVAFFSSVADSIKSRYQELTSKVTKDENSSISIATPESKENRSTTATDDYTPVLETPEAEETTTPTEVPEEEAIYTNPEDDSVADSDNESTTDEESVPATEDDSRADSNVIKRSASMDFKMKLEFSLASFTQMVEEIADGEKSVTEFAAAGFGLSAGIDITGKQVVDSTSSDIERNPGRMRGMNALKSQQAGSFAANSKNFKLRTFYSESSRIARSLKLEHVSGYQRAVNKFALRYRLDNKFSFEYLNRFNSQTEELNNVDGSSVGSYIDAASANAEYATNDMMATFFGAVDDYLASAESDLLTKAEEYFSMAAEELGFSTDMIDMVKSQITDSIESFFNKVESSVSLLESKYVTQPEIATQPETPSVEEDPVAVTNEQMMA